MLEAFLYFNALLIGVLVVLAVQHGVAHFKPHKYDAEHHQATPQNGHLPPAIREQLIESARKHYQTVLNHAAQELEQDLENTAVDIKKQIQKLGTDTVQAELENYRAKIAALEKQTEDTVNGMHAEIASHQDDLKAKLTESVEAEKQRLISQIDTKLADAVASFLNETLQHNIDLGAQAAYLTSVLEEHKAELAKEVSGDS